MSATLEKQAGLFDCDVREFDTRDEWLSARRSWIGASDTAAIFGEGYAEQSPLTVFDSKVNRREDGGETKRLRIGRLMEPALRAIFSEETGLECHGFPAYTIHVSRSVPFLAASLDDATVHDEFGPCPVELKNVSNFNKTDWLNDEPPLKFNVQCQHQMAVTGASHAFLLGLIGGHEPIVKTIPRNQRFIDAMLKRLDDFWGYVVRREIPPVDESLATGKLLARLWTENEGASVFLPTEATDWAEELEGAKEAIKEAEAQKVAAENRIKAAIGEATFGVLPDGRRFSWKTQHKKEYVVAASSTRVLRLCK